MKKKRLLFRIERLRGGGAEKSLVKLIQYLDHSKYQVDLLLDHRDGIYLNQVPKQVGLFYIVDGKAFFSKNCIIRLLQKIRRELQWGFYRIFPKLVYNLRLGNKKYDIEIGFLESILPYMSKGYLSPKSIGWIHLDLKGGVYNKKEVDRIIASAQKTDSLIAVSRQAKDALSSLEPTLEQKTKVIYNPIEITEVIEKSLQNQVRSTSEKTCLLSIGRLCQQKGFDRLIKVCQRLKQEGINFQLSIMGEGSDRATLTTQITNCRLTDNIQLLGYKDNPYPYIQATDIFVLSSRAEGMPYVILETLILNKPIVSTDVSGPRELLKDRELGLLVDNSEKGLYQGLKKMITDENLRIFFIQKEKDFNPFEPKYIAQQVEEIINNLISI